MLLVPFIAVIIILPPPSRPQPQVTPTTNSLHRLVLPFTTAAPQMPVTALLLHNTISALRIALVYVEIAHKTKVHMLSCSTQLEQSLSYSHDVYYTGQGLDIHSS